MNRQAAPCGNQKHAFNDCLFIQSARIGGYSGDELWIGLQQRRADGLFNGRHFFQWMRAWHGNDDFTKDVSASRPQADLVNCHHLGNIRNDLAQMIGHARWRDIHQSINRLAAQTIAGNGNEEGNANGGQRIALLKAKLRGNEP